MVVGKGNECFVSASIVPVEVVRFYKGNHQSRRLSKPSASFSPSSSSSSPEEKKLVGGSCLLSPATTTCLARRMAGIASFGNLRGLVKDDVVEEGDSLDKVAYREWACHPTGTDCGQHLARFLWNNCLNGFSLRFRAASAQTVASCSGNWFISLTACSACALRTLFAASFSDPVEPAELFNKGVMRCTDEA